MKRGCAFRLAVLIREYDGAVVDLTGCTFACQLRDVLGELLAELTVRPVAGRTGVVQITYAGDTGVWSPGQYRCDLCTVWPDGTIQSSETFSVSVIAGVTAPGDAA